MKLTEWTFMVVFLGLSAAGAGYIFNKITPFDPWMLQYTGGQTWIGVNLAIAAVMIPLHVWSEGL